AGSILAVPSPTRAVGRRPRCSVRSRPARASPATSREPPRARGGLPDALYRTRSCHNHRHALPANRNETNAERDGEKQLIGYSANPATSRISGLPEHPIGGKSSRKLGASGRQNDERVARHRIDAYRVVDGRTVPAVLGPASTLPRRNGRHP